MEARPNKNNSKPNDRVAMETADGSPQADTQSQIHSLSSIELPTEFGRYQLLKKLGVGGMGTVYLARDMQLDREVALKMPRFSEENYSESVKRFIREAKTAAKLQNNNICAVYDVGEINNQHYITMAYIKGRTMTEIIAADQLPKPRTAAILIHRIAKAMQDAHKMNIVHRDLKPANIMIDEKKEPVVMDFGLAKNTNDESRVTHSGAVLGTPAYMSPEQVRGQQDEIGPQSDVFSLGSIFHELLTGKRPFDGQGIATIAYQIAHEEPTPISEVRPEIDPQLEQICQRMMAKKKSDRYESMEAVADALKNYVRSASSSKSASLVKSQDQSQLDIGGETVEMRRFLAEMPGEPKSLNSNGNKPTSFAKYPALITFIIILILGISFGVGILFKTPYGTIRVETEGKLEDLEVIVDGKTLTLNSTQKLEAGEHQLRLEVAGAELQLDPVSNVFRIIEDGKEKRLQVEIDGVQLKSSSFKMKRNEKQTITVSILADSPSAAGSQIAKNAPPASSRMSVTAPARAEVTPENSETQPATNSTSQAALTITRRMVRHYFGFNGNLKDEVTNQIGKTHGQTTLSNTAIAGSGSLLNQAGEGLNALSIDFVEPTINQDEFSISIWIRLFQLPPDFPNELVFQRYFSMDSGNDDFSLGVSTREMSGFATSLGRSMPNSIEFERWQHVVAIRKYNQLSYFLDGQLIDSQELQQPLPSFRRVTIGGLRVGVAGTGETLADNRDFNGLLDEVTIFDSALSPAQVMQLHQNPGIVESLFPSQNTSDLSQVVAAKPTSFDQYHDRDLSPDEIQLAGRGVDVTLPQEVVRVLGDSQRMHWGNTRCGNLRFSPSGKYLAWGSVDGLLDIWNNDATELTHRFEVPDQAIARIAWAPDESFVIAGFLFIEPRNSLEGFHNLVKFDLKNKEFETFSSSRSDESEIGGLTCVSVGLDNQHVFSITGEAGSAGLPRRIDLATGEVTTFGVARPDVRWIEHHPSEKLVAIVGGNSLVQLYDSVTLEEVSSFRNANAQFSNCCTFPATMNSLLIGACNGERLNLWDYAEKTEQSFSGTNHWIWDIRTDRSGRYAVTSEQNGRISSFDTQTGEPQLIYDFRESSKRSLDVNWSGNLLASSGNDNRLTIIKNQTNKPDNFDSGSRLLSLALLDDSQVAWSGENGVVKIWDVENDQTRSLPPLNTKAIVDVAFWKQRNRILYATLEGQLVCHTLADPKAANSVKLDHPVIRMTVHPTKPIALLGLNTDEQNLVAWDFLSNRVRPVPLPALDDIHLVRYSPDGERVAIGDGKNSLVVLDTSTMQVIEKFSDLPTKASEVRFHPQKNLFAAVVQRDSVGSPPTMKARFSRCRPNRPGALWVFDLAGKTRFEIPDIAANSIDFSSDGKFLAIAGNDGKLRILETTNWTTLESIQIGPPFGSVIELKFNSTGSHIVTANGNGTVFLVRNPRVKPAMN